MHLHTNIKFLRGYLRLTQAQFGKLFNKTRSNIDSYERGNARPDEETQREIAAHFNLPLEVLISKDLQMNPGLLLAGSSFSALSNVINEDAMKAKDETIRELKSQCKSLQDQISFLQQQNDRLLKKLKVA